MELFKIQLATPELCPFQYIQNCQVTFNFKTHTHTQTQKEHLIFQQQTQISFGSMDTIKYCKANSQTLQLMTNTQHLRCECKCGTSSIRDERINFYRKQKNQVKQFVDGENVNIFVAHVIRILCLGILKNLWVCVF